MLILFRSKAAAEILMLGPHAKMLLQAAGKNFDDNVLPERGVITSEQLDQAIAGIEEMLARSADDEEREHEDQDNEHVPPVAEYVGVRRRAWPLMNMLRKAQEMQVDVTWEPAPSW